MTPKPLPAELRGSAIRTSTGADHGLTRARLRNPDVQHPHHGVSAVDLDGETVRNRCLAFLPVMEAGQAFSHTTALALRGAPLPRTTGIHVSVVFPRTPPQRAGVVGHALTEVPTGLLDGMPVVPPVVAWAQAATLLERADVVAVADHLLGRGHSADELAAQVERWSRRPGAARLRWALTRMRAGVRSRPETHLRLLLVRSRLPEPVVGHPVPVAGGIVLHPDLAYPSARLALEYEGLGHLTDRRTWEGDIERRELLADAGWRTIRVTSSQLSGDPRALVARIRRHVRR